jgi:hypothetical protein
MKLFFLTIATGILIAIIFVGNNIGNEKYFLNYYKKYFSDNLKVTLKETIFVFQNQKVLKNLIKKEQEQSQNITKQALLISFDKLYFNKQVQNNSKVTFYNSGVTNILSKRGYLQYYNNLLYLVTGTGKIFSGEISKSNQTIVLSDLKSNFLEIAGMEYLIESKSIVNHFLIDKNNLYLSFTKKINNNCYNNSILIAELNGVFLNFKNFFSTNQCLSNFFNYSSGGRLSVLDDEHVMFSTGDFDPYSNNDPYPQYDDDLRGKILKINTINGSYSLLSKGHRNPQGLFYDTFNKIIFSTDHGPQGGDEINMQELKDKKIKNFGWPISSYGSHYNSEDVKKIGIFNYSGANSNKFKSEEKYKKQPLFKSHAKQNFAEPIMTWKDQSIAPTQVISVYDERKKEFHLYVGGLGNLDELHKSVHQLVFDKDFNLLKNRKIKINQRIRDMIFVKDTNSIILFLEETASIAFIEIE